MMHSTNLLTYLLTKLYWLVMEGDVCEQLAQSQYITVEWPGYQPATYGSLV